MKPRRLDTLRPRLLGGVLITFCMWISPVLANSFAVDAESWQQPRSASMIKSLPAVRAAVQAWQGKPGSRLIIHHQSDEEGALWGAELRDWLVSLGVPPENIGLVPGEVLPAALNLEVVPR